MFLYHFRVHLFSCSFFYVCGVKNATRCLVIHQTTFYIVGPTKKLSLKRSFYEVVFTCHFNRVS